MCPNAIRKKVLLYFYLETVFRFLVKLIKVIKKNTNSLNESDYVKTILRNQTQLERKCFWRNTNLFSIHRLFFLGNKSLSTKPATIETTTKTRTSRRIYLLFSKKNRETTINSNVSRLQRREIVDCRIEPGHPVDPINRKSYTQIQYNICKVKWRDRSVCCRINRKWSQIYLLCSHTRVLVKLAGSDLRRR